MAIGACAILSRAGLEPARRVLWDMALERSVRHVRTDRIPGLGDLGIVFAGLQPLTGVFRSQK